MAEISELFAPSSTANLTPTYSYTDADDMMGKEDFLKLLVAQLQNQDPLNPDDATEFTSQLAEFSSLEQLQNLNGSLEEIAAIQQQSDRFATMDLIGNEVVYTSSSFNFDGTPSSVGYRLDGTAASVTMTIVDENGSTVASLRPTELTQGDHFLQWDGLDNEGNIVPEGNYKLIIEATSAGEDETIAASPLVQSEVVGVDFSSENGDAIIHTMAGAEISSNAIIAVYQANQTYDKEITEEDQEEETIVDEVVGDVVDAVSADVTGTLTSPNTEDSASTDDEQIEQDALQHFLAGN
ncbi:MAG: flagellar hook assembly protein FlgD [Desulfocapsa sp.]|nr:flagellar hook assembly protein FlgD [Desulfocapsa sp.]